MEILQILVGLTLLVAGADLLVRGASSVALRLGVSSLVVSLTLVGVGTSAPEVAVTVQAGLTGRAGMALGNVVGSNVANVGLVIGVCALIRALSANRSLVRFDVPVVIALTALVGGLARHGGALSALDGFVLLFVFVAYLAITVRRGVMESRKESSNREGLGLARGAIYLSLFALGLAGLVFGSRMLVGGASSLALLYGMPEALVGSTIVAIGTSLPEVATSAVATLRGDLGVAVGNAVGSCIANFGLVLGVGCIAAGTLPVPEQLVRIEILAALAISVVLLLFLVTRSRVNRLEAAMLVAGYGVYFWAVTRASSPEALGRLPFVFAAYAGFLALVVLLELRTYFLPRRAQRTL